MTIDARKEPMTAGLDRPDGPQSYRSTDRDAISWRLFRKVAPCWSHDFRVRLNTLVLNFELLKRYADAGPLSPERARHYAEKMHAEVRQLERLLAASVEAPRPDQTAVDRFDFLAICSDVATLAESYARPERIRVRSALAETPMNALGEHEAVWVAMSSLLVHMIDALPKGTHLLISLHAEQRLATFSAAAYAPAEGDGGPSSTPAGWAKEPDAAAIESAREILAGHDAQLVFSEPRGPARLTVEMPLTSLGS